MSIAQEVTSVKRVSTAYRPDIDGLRAVAVLAVMVFHAIPNYLPGGFIGVDIFFVISGFLISGIIFSSIEMGRFSFVEFYRRRITRIFPSLMLVLTFCIITGFFVFGSQEFQELGLSVIFSTTFLANFLFWSQSGYFDVNANLKPLLNLWSLGVEEQFYVIWPFCLILVMRLRFKAGLALLVLISCVSLTISQYGAVRGFTWSFFLPMSRLWELGLGAILSYLMRWRQLPAVWYTPNLVGLGGMIAIVGAAVFFNSEMPFPGLYALVPTLGTTAILSADKSFMNQRVLSTKPIVAIGLISYPLYLWHWPLLAMVRQVSDSELSLWTVAAVLVATIVISIGTYILVEKPIRFRIARKIPFLTSAALLVSSVCIGLIGTAIYMGSGMPDRLPSFWREFEAHPYQFGWDQRGLTCFQTEFSSVGAFPASCDERVKGDGKASVLLWGDSFAAALYPGMRDAAKMLNFDLIQYNTARCPPVLAYRSKFANCSGNNAWVENKIKENPPDVVLITSAWRNYKVESGSPTAENLRADLRQTLRTLKSDGVAKVIVVDSVTQWPQLLSQIVRNRLRMGSSLPPQRMKAALYDGDVAISQILLEVAQEFQDRYVNPLDYLCNEDGCLVRTGPYVSDLTTWDNAHLTPAASKYLISQIHGLLP